MTEKLYRLIYISENTIDGDQDILEKEISSILEYARQSNDKTGITGALMFSRGCFAQVLEGPLESVETTFERIECDMRHSDVVILSFTEVHERGFESWSMGYIGGNTDAWKDFADLHRESGFDRTAMPADEIYALLQQHLESDDQGSDQTIAA